LGFGFEIIFIAEPFYLPALNKCLGLFCTVTGDEAETLGSVIDKRMSRIEMPPEVTPRSSLSPGRSSKPVLPTKYTGSHKYTTQCDSSAADNGGLEMVSESV